MSANFRGNICAGPSFREVVGVPTEPPKLDATWGLVTGEDTELDLEPDDSEESFSGSCCFICCWLEECGLFEAVELKGVPLEETERGRRYKHTALEETPFRGKLLTA